MSGSYFFISFKSTVDKDALRSAGQEANLAFRRPRAGVPYLATQNFALTDSDLHSGLSVVLDELGAARQAIFSLIDISEVVVSMRILIDDPGSAGGFYMPNSFLRGMTTLGAGIDLGFSVRDR